MSAKHTVRRRLVAAREYEDDDQAFVDAVSVDWDDAT
ncbi:hypothetical protein MRGA327_16265 [Mycobacterium tuberculosis RGTB327]|nr:hypothetical protein MRGA327_16265 [Mycobacterium tuberculosis RGTB327]